MGKWGQCLENSEKFVYIWLYLSFGCLGLCPCLPHLPVSAPCLPKSSPMLSLIMEESFQNVHGDTFFQFYFYRESKIRL